MLAKEQEIILAAQARASEKASLEVILHFHYDPTRGMKLSRTVKELVDNRQNKLNEVAAIFPSDMQGMLL